MLKKPGTKEPHTLGFHLYKRQNQATFIYVVLIQDRVTFMGGWIVTRRCEADFWGARNVVLDLVLVP